MTRKKLFLPKSVSPNPKPIDPLAYFQNIHVQPAQPLARALSHKKIFASQPPSQSSSIAAPGRFSRAKLRQLFSTQAPDDSSQSSILLGLKQQIYDLSQLLQQCEWNLQKKSIAQRLMREGIQANKLTDKPSQFRCADAQKQLQRRDEIIVSQQKSLEESKQKLDRQRSELDELIRQSKRVFGKISRDRGRGNEFTMRMSEQRGSLETAKSPFSIRLDL